MVTKLITAPREFEKNLIPIDESAMQETIGKPKSKKSINRKKMQRISRKKNR